LQDIPIYSVGPATTRCLKAISQDPPLNIFGEHTGNGDSLARFILEHYSHWYADSPEKPALLFMVGEQRRDIIPKTLMNESLVAEERIPVDELVVYGTGVMESFHDDLGQVLHHSKSRDMRWVVVFSPTGCDVMLRGLGLLDETTGKAKTPTPDSDRRTWVATIGPTTRDYLTTTFGFEPDVCAEIPSPEGIRAGIVEFLNNRI
jgi:uroporphyrinogen-III synthase